MDEGVGRQGYRVLAGVIAAIGTVGLITAVYAFRPALDLFQWLGFGLLLAALLGLLAVTLVVLGRKPARPLEERLATDDAGHAPAPVPAVAAPQRRPQVQETPPQEIKVERMRTLGAASAPLDKPLPRPPAPPAGARAMPPGADPAQGMEFGDAKPAARAAPEQLVLPKAFQGAADRPAGAEAADNERDPKAWPERRAPGQPRIRPGDMAVRAAQMLNEGPVTVMARVWYPRSTLPRGWNKGRCGDCGTQLMAPPERPINLRCPHCDKVTLMEKAA